jgi:hypothetical protein
MEGIASIFCPIIYSIVSQRLRKRFMWGVLTKGPEQGALAVISWPYGLLSRQRDLCEPAPCPVLCWMREKVRANDYLPIGPTGRLILPPDTDFKRPASAT